MENGTEALDLPPDETGPVPVQLATTSRFPPAFVEGADALRRLRRAVRDRSQPLLESLSVRLRAQRELARIRYQLEELTAERRSLLAELGEAVYAEDEKRSDEVRASLRELDERTVAREAEQREVVGWAEAQVRQAYLESQPTEVASREPESA